MGRSIVEKILHSHLIAGEAIAGKPVTVKIDQTLTQDATGTMASLQLEVLNPKKLKTELSVGYVDHNTVQIGFENFDDHAYLRGIAAKYGIYYSKAGNGICHQVHLERFGVPGKTLLGSDSHTPTAGGIGMFAVGAGGLDVAIAMAGGTFTFTYPRVTGVMLKGRLSPWVAAKDVILKVLSVLGTRGNVGTVLEYTGEGVKTLSVPERATIANMGAETGVTTSVFPSDEETRAFLIAQGRGDSWVELKPDEDAVYSKTIELNLSGIEPMAALPHSPGNVVPVRDTGGIKVDQVAIGSCTNSSYKDLMTAAKMLEGKTVHPDVSFVIAPGSKQVLRMIADNGALSTLIAAGARIAEAACGFCIGNSHAPGTDSVSVRTSNRNFRGRSGTESARVYLTSVETAVASAINGVLTDPRESGMQYPRVELPEHFTVDDSMIVKPKEGKRDIAVFRGPNIGEPPVNTPLPPHIEGLITIKVGDKITTDHIMPAGDKLKYRSNIPRYAEFVFAPVDEEFSRRALKNKQRGVANIIVGGDSYGQGSSREHAALCPMYLGVKAVIVKSFERIHIANLINAGILPLTFKNENDYENLAEGDEISIPRVRDLIQKAESIKLFNKSQNKEIELGFNLSNEEREVILAGGRLNWIRNQEAE